MGGYAGDGVSCEDVDECANNPCGDNAACTNTDGGFQCICDAGFVKKNGACVDVNECANNKKNNCNRNAICTNLPGSFSCACKANFEGDGVTCSTTTTTTTFVTYTFVPSCS